MPLRIFANIRGGREEGFRPRLVDMLEPKFKIPSGIHGQACRVGADHDVVQKGTHPGARGGKCDLGIGGSSGESQHLGFKRIIHLVAVNHVLDRLTRNADVQTPLHRCPTAHLKLHQKCPASPAEIQGPGGHGTHRRRGSHLCHPAGTVNPGHRQEVAVTCP